MGETVLPSGYRLLRLEVVQLKLVVTGTKGTTQNRVTSVEQVTITWYAMRCTSLPITVLKLAT